MGDEFPKKSRPSSEKKLFDETTSEGSHPTILISWLVHFNVPSLGGLLRTDYDIAVVYELQLEILLLSELVQTCN